MRGRRRADHPDLHRIDPNVRHARFDLRDHHLGRYRQHRLHAQRILRGDRGDGAGAVLLEPSNDGNGFQDAILKSDGSGRDYLNIKAGGSLKPASIETVMAKEHYAFQDGQPVFKFAVKGMADVSAELLEKNNLTGDDIAWLVPHQANLRIIDATANRMGLPMEKVMINIQKYGNTTAATIPLCLWDWESQLKKGDNLVLAAFGGGFTWGACWLKWAY